MAGLRKTIEMSAHLWKGQADFWPAWASTILKNLTTKRKTEMKTHHFPFILLVLVLFLALAACAGGGSGGTGNTGGGVGGSGIISRGAISEFGSIVVNGTEFKTTSAVVMINGEAVGIGDTAVQAHLDKGKVVTVQGTSGGWEECTVAEKVIYRSDVEGPVAGVDASDPDAVELTVMGQTVMVNYLTQLKNIDLQGIVQGNVVEVSGFYDNQGIVWATFLEDKGTTYAVDAVYEVKGVVEALDTDQKTFMLNGLQVNYSAADASGLPGGEPVDGLLVETEGTVDPAFTQMSANIVDPEDEIGADNAEEVEVTGFVTYYIAVDEFIVGNQVVVVEDGAVFVDGDQGDIAPGKKIEAEGELVGGILRAWEIEFWEPDQFEIEGPVTHIQFINYGTGESEFTVDDDQVVVTTAQTVYEDGDLADIELGVDVEIKGRMQGDDMVADKVSFELGGI
jgi:hypothetical protein